MRTIQEVFVFTSKDYGRDKLTCWVSAQKRKVTQLEYSTTAKKPNPKNKKEHGTDCLLAYAVKISV